jgi:sulfur relay (sulfurtransferase) complex TusBCD TusD component (DsrE family)
LAFIKGVPVSNYVLIDSRGPFEIEDIDYLRRLAESLASAGHAVTVFLLQNGVLGARPGSRLATHLSHLGSQRVRVLADDDSLKERAVASVTDGVRRSNLDRRSSSSHVSGMSNSIGSTAGCASMNAARATGSKDRGAAGRRISSRCHARATSRW